MQLQIPPAIYDVLPLSPNGLIIYYLRDVTISSFRQTVPCTVLWL
jgi:hypothetical protein